MLSCKIIGHKVDERKGKGFYKFVDLSSKTTDNIRQFKNIGFFLLILLISGLTGCTGSNNATNSDIDYELDKKMIASNAKSNVGDLSVDMDQSNDLIKPGDKIQIMVWGYPEFNTTTTVKDFGTITVPLIGDVMAAGMNQNDFSKQIKQQLTVYVKGDPKITVSHIEMDKLVSIMGAVSKQDNYPVIYNEQLVELIAAAGGPVPGADLRHIKIFRNSMKNNVIEVDLTDHLQNGSIATIPKVKPGDTVFVPVEENLMREISDYARDILLLFGFFRLLY